jgi:hypothetical protein
LDTYFKGYNMEFELDMNGAAPSLNEVKLYQGVKK